MLGLAAGFLVAAAMSFTFHGLFGFYYLLLGGACAFASFVVAMMGSRRPVASKDPAVQAGKLA